MLFLKPNNEKQTFALKAGVYLSALLILCTPFSTSAASIIPFLLLCLWLFTRQYSTLPLTLKSNPVALFAFLLVCDFLFGMSYTTASTAEALSVLGKYRELLWIILLIPFFQIEVARKWAWNALFLSLLITLLSSYAMHFSLLESPHPEKAPTSIKTHITHGLFIAYFAFYCSHRMLQSTLKIKVIYLACIILSAYNLFFVVAGRTGQLVFLLLFLLFSLQKLNKIGAIICLLLMIIFLFLFLNYSENAHRITDGFTNITSYFRSAPDNDSTSMGQRLTFWQHSLGLISEKPWLGHGTGSFSNEYLRIADNAKIATNNPHNEYLMIAVQLGLLGFLLFLGFLLSQLVCSFKLDEENKFLAQGVLLALATNSLVNSSWLDNTEGHWFASLIALCFAGLQEKE